MIGLAVPFLGAPHTVNVLVPGPFWSKIGIQVLVVLSCGVTIGVTITTGGCGVMLGGNTGVMMIGTLTVSHLPVWSHTIKHTLSAPV